MDYGKKLRELRIQNGYTQQDFADALGIARITYNHYETQEKIIPIERLVNLSNQFNFSIDYIMGFSDKVNYLNNASNININLSKERLKTLRKDNKITQDKLAKKLNVSRTTITEYERGTNIIATSFLYFICKEYNISADYLLGRIDKPKNIDK